MSAILNYILMFIPLGFLISLLTKRVNKLETTFLICVSASLLLCLFAKFIMHNNVTSDILIFNTVGGVIGFLIYKLFEIISNKIKTKE